MKSIKAWSRNVRLEKTILAILAIALGSALAQHEGFHVQLLHLLLMLSTAVGLQLMANVANDYGDRLRGVDTPEQLMRARGACYALPTIPELAHMLKKLSLFTVANGSALLILAAPQSWWRWASLGAAAMVASITYTLGPFPYGYYALGDFFVFIFFGLVGVYGSYRLHGAPPCAMAFYSAMAFGFLIASQLTLNNLRDRQHDLRSAKHTLAGSLGARWGGYYYLLLLLLSALCLTLAATRCTSPHLWPLTLYVLLILHCCHLTPHGFTRSMQLIMLLISFFISALLCCNAGTST